MKINHLKREFWGCAILNIFNVILIRDQDKFNTSKGGEQKSKNFAIYGNWLMLSPLEVVEFETVNEGEHDIYLSTFFFFQVVLVKAVFLKGKFDEKKDFSHEKTSKDGFVRNL